MKVYCIENNLDNKKYVGITRGEIIGRFKSHKRIAKNPNNKNHCHIHKAMFKYGLENFAVYQIDSAETKEELLEKEKHWIKKLDTKNNGYNETDGGEGCFGWKATKEQKEANRKRNIERMKDPLNKERQSIIAKEYWDNLPEDIKLERIERFNKTKIGNKHVLGKTWKLSNESKMNVSNAKSQEWLIIHPNDKKEKIKNLNEFCRKNNLDSGAMSNVAKGKNKHHKGYSCQKVTN